MAGIVTKAASKQRVTALLLGAVFFFVTSPAFSLPVSAVDYATDLMERREGEGGVEYVFFVREGKRTIAQVNVEGEAGSPLNDTSPEIQNAGPWPLGKTSSGAERFSAGISESRYTPPGLKAGPTSVSEISSNRLPDVIDGESGLASNAAGSTWTNVDDAPTSQSLNPHSYVLNNPLRYTDPTGWIPVDTIWDIGNVLWDIGKIVYGAVSGDSDMVEEGTADLALDTAAIALPYVPAGAGKLGQLVAQYGDDAVKLTTDAADTAKKANKSVKAAKAKGAANKGKRSLARDEKIGSLINPAAKSRDENPMRKRRRGIIGNLEIPQKNHPNIHRGKSIRKRRERRLTMVATQYLA